MVKISPSILACNFNKIGDEIKAMKNAGADMMHLDIMDGHFVPNVTFGPPVIVSLRNESDAFFDVHLMISEPLDYIGAFVKAGANMITFHIESESDPVKTLDAIKSHGVKCGLALKPKTPVSEIKDFLPLLDMVLVMTVEPGFGGQKFIPDTLPKLRELRRYANELNPGLDVEVDGGIGVDTAPLVAAAGANVLVAGSSLFSSPDYAVAVSTLRGSAEIL